MDFGIKCTKIVFILLSLYTSMTKGLNIDCNGKAFHCMNTTHFKICVDLGGVSKTVDDFLLPCPSSTYCMPTNNYECEYYETTITTTTITARELNDLEASVIPLIFQDDKLNSAPDMNVPVSNNTKYNDSFLPKMLVTPVLSSADKQITNFTKDVELATTHVIEDLNAEVLKNVYNQTAVKTMNDKIKNENFGISLDNLKALANNSDHTKNITMIEHGSFPTETLATIIEISNMSVKAILPTEVTSFTQDRKNNKTSHPLEATHTFDDAKSNNTFVINNISVRKNTTFNANKSDVVDPDTDAFVRTDKNIEVANIIVTPVNMQGNFNVHNEITEESLIGNETSIKGSFAFDNKIIRKENRETPVSNITDNINSETTTTTSVAVAITPIVSIPLITTERTEHYTTPTDLPQVTYFVNRLQNSSKIFYDWNNSTATIEPQLEKVITNTTKSHETRFSTSIKNFNFTTENYNRTESFQNETEKYLIHKMGENNNTMNGLQVPIIMIEQNVLYQEVPANIKPRDEILNHIDNTTSGLKLTNIITNKDRNNLPSNQQNFASINDFVQLPSTKLSNEIELINIETGPMPSSESTSKFLLLQNTSGDYELTRLKKDLLNITVFPSNQDNGMNVFSENNTKTPSTESNNAKVLNNFASITNVISTTGKYNSEKYLDEDSGGINNSVKSLRETKLQTGQNSTNFKKEDETGIGLIENTTSVGSINKSTNNNYNQDLIINSNDRSLVDVNYTLNSEILRKDPTASLTNETRNTKDGFATTTSFVNFNGLSLPLYTSEKFGETTERSNLSHVTDVINDSENRNNIIAGVKQSSSTLESQIENSVTIAPASYESKLLNNLNLTTNVTTKFYRKQLPENDSDKYVVDETAHSYTIDDFEIITIQTELKYPSLSQQEPTNSKHILTKGLNSTENTFKNEDKVINLSSTLFITDSASVVTTTEMNEPKFVPNVIAEENISDKFPISNIKKIVFTSTEKYTNTDSSKSNFNFEDNALTNSRNIFSPSTEKYGLTTLPPSLLHHFDTPNNSNIHDQRNGTTIGNYDVRNENTIHSHTETLLLNIIQNKPNASIPLNMATSDSLVIEQPSNFITKSFTRQTTITPTISDHMISPRSDQFEEIITTEIPKTNSKIMDAPPEEKLLSTSINNNNNNKVKLKIINDLPTHGTTTIATLTTQKLILNSRTVNTVMENDKIILNTNFEDNKPNNTINKNSSGYNTGLEYKSNSEQSDFKLINLGSHNRENATASEAANNVDIYVVGNVSLLQTPNKLTVLLSGFATPIRNESNSSLNKSLIPNQLDKNVSDDSEQTFETKKDIRPNMVNKTSKSVLMDEAKKSENKEVKYLKPIIYSTLLENGYESNKSRGLKINESNSLLSSHNPENSIIHKKTSNTPTDNSSLITNHMGLNPEVSHKINNSQICFTALNATDFNHNSNISTNKNRSNTSLVALILPPSIFNSTQQTNNESKFINTNLTRNLNKVNVHINYLQKTLDKNCNNLPTGKYADKNDCKKFYLCSGEIQSYVGECPNGTVFSESKKLCTKNLSQCYRNHQFRCLSAGRYYDLRVKNVYYICVQNINKFIKFKFQCQNGYTLNKTIIQCVEDQINISSVISRDSSSTNDEGTSISIESSTKVADESKASNDSDGDQNEFECKKEGKFPHPDDSGKYYLCSKETKLVFRRRLKYCDSDEIFDKEKQKCIEIDS